MKRQPVGSESAQRFIRGIPAVEKRAKEFSASRTAFAGTPEEANGLNL
jgi:hypothetical protein